MQVHVNFVLNTKKIAHDEFWTHDNMFCIMNCVECIVKCLSGFEAILLANTADTSTVIFQGGNIIRILEVDPLVFRPIATVRKENSSISDRMSGSGEALHWMAVGGGELRFRLQVHHDVDPDGPGMRADRVDYAIILSLSAGSDDVLAVLATLHLTGYFGPEGVWTWL